MKRIILILACVSIFLLSCGRNGQSVISGTIEGAAGSTIYLERYVNNRGVKTDSTVIGKDGSFVLAPNRPLDMNFYRLILSDRDFIVLITDSTESPQVNGKAGDLNLGAKVTGSENTIQLREFETACQAIYNKQGKAVEKMKQPGVTAEQAAQYKQEALDARKELNTYVKKWLESHSSVPTALAAVQMLDMRAELDSYKKVVADLGKTFGHSTHFKMLKQKVETASAAPQMLNDPREIQQEEVSSAVAIGKTPPEIALPDPNGKIRKLSDLQGKVVLIDFWASWCGPCRRENPNVLKAYNKYNQYGFEVMSVSLDKDANAWKMAIQQDGLIWPNHVSDLQFWDSKAAADYGVHSIPFPVLVGQDGKVIAYGPNVRGNMLEDQLKELLGR